MDGLGRDDPFHCPPSVTPHAVNILTDHMKYMYMSLMCLIHACCHSWELAKAVFMQETEVRVLRKQQLVINKWFNQEFDNDKKKKRKPRYTIKRNLVSPWILCRSCDSAFRLRNVKGSLAIWYNFFILQNLFCTPLNGSTVSVADCKKEKKGKRRHSYVHPPPREAGESLKNPFFSFSRYELVKHFVRDIH